MVALLNFSNPFVVEKNAPGSGIGVVLMQEKHPIAYISNCKQHFRAIVCIEATNNQLELPPIQAYTMCFMCLS